MEGKNQEAESKRCSIEERYINSPNLFSRTRNQTIEEWLKKKGGGGGGGVVVARGIRENGCRTDMEQLRINWFADEIQLRTNSRQDEQSNRNECGPHSSKRTEKRESTTCSIHPPLLSSPRVHRFPLFPSSSSSFLYSFSKRTRATIPRYGRKRSRCCYTFLRVQFDSAPSPDLWWTTCPSPSLESKNRWKGYGETDPFKIPIGILRRNFLDFCNLEIKYLSFLNR